MAEERTAISLFENKFDRQIPFLNHYWGGTVGAVIGLITAVMVNYQQRRPVFSSLQRHFLYTLVGGGSVQWLQNYADDYYAERDAVYRHYISLHPEDFVLPARKKYSEILEVWTPIR